MDTKDNRNSPKMPLRPSFSREGVVVPGAWVALTAQCLCRFFLGAVLSRGMIFDGYIPFALGFVAASGAGMPGFSALLGVGMGVLLGNGLAGGLRDLAAGVLIYAVSFAFSGLNLCATVWFLPLCAGLLSGITGFLSLSELGWQTEHLICYFTQLLLTAFSCRFYLLTLPPEEGDPVFPPRPGEHSAAILLTGGSLLISLSSVPLPGSLSPGGILACAGVLWAAGGRGAGTGAVTGVTFGLCLDLAAGGGYTAMLGLGGILAGLCGPGRIFPSLAMAAGIAAGALWSYPVQESFLPLWEGFLGISLLSLIPRKLLSRLEDALIPPLTADRGGEGAPESSCAAVRPLKDRLRRQAAAFSHLYDQLSADLGREPPVHTVSAGLFLQASGRVCSGCAFRTSCWKRDYPETCRILEPVLSAMESRGHAAPEDFPPAFTARCARLNELVNAANSAFTALLSRRWYQRRLREGRRDLCRQYLHISRVLDTCALSLEEVSRPALAPPALSATAGVAAAKKTGQEISGDTGGWFRDEQGSLWVVLCDGMGSGAQAARDSRLAYRLLEEFLTCGIHPRCALSVIAGAMSLRQEATGSFTTVDLLQLDLATGQGSVYKMGAAPTYLRRGGVLTSITGASLPAGLAQDPGPEINRFLLRPGDLAVLISDGVTEGEDDNWLRDQISAFHGESPRDLAAALLTRRTDAGDDRTAIVLSIQGTQV